MRAGATFTFETVMSSPDKIHFMREALNGGFLHGLLRRRGLPGSLSSGTTPTPSDRVFVLLSLSLPWRSDPLATIAALAKCNPVPQETP